MRIHVVRSGGIAGLRSEQSLDTSLLPEPLRGQLFELVESAAFFGLAGEMRTRMPDMTQYRVRIEAEGREHEVCFDDACADTTLLELVERVGEAAKLAAG